jgi:arylsulfatase A-like enzyme
MGCDFISRQVEAKRPFYLEIDQYPGRQGESATAETIAEVKKRLGDNYNTQNLNRAAGCQEIDKAIGIILDQLKQKGISGTTYIIYTADHGAQGANSNGVLTNGKGTIWEGGLRVPLLVSGPGIKAGLFSHIRASLVDVLPTITELAGVKKSELPLGLEGASLVAVLKGQSEEPPARSRDDFVVHYPHYDKDDLGPTSAIFYKNYKLIRVYETGKNMLFDLSNDISERHDLADKFPDVVKDLDRRLTEYLVSQNGLLPKPNPNYNPSGARSVDSKGGKKGKNKS